MSQLNLSLLTQEQLDQLMQSISTIQNLTANNVIPQLYQEQEQPQEEPKVLPKVLPNVLHQNILPQQSSPIRPIESESHPILLSNDSIIQNSPAPIQDKPIVISKLRTPSFLAKRNITLPINSELSNFKLTSTTNILSRINESLNLLQETYKEIGLPDDELMKSESFLMEKLNELMRKADFDKQSLNLEIMTIMNNISEIDNILTTRFKYDYIIDDSIKDTINKFNARFRHSISNNEISAILLELHPVSTSLLDLKEKLLTLFHQLSPRYTNKVVDLSNKTLKFYDYYSKIDSYDLKNENLLSQLPSLDEANKYINETAFGFQEVDYIINDTIYKEISHNLFAEIDDELVSLKEELKMRIQNLIQLSKDITKMYLDLFIDLEQNSKVLYLNEIRLGEFEFENLVELIHQNIGLKKKTFQEIKDIHDKLSKDKESRQLRLSSLRTDCQQLWYRLDQETQYINNFLKNNNNLKLQSLQLFESELQRLNKLKLQHIASFIEESRSKIKESWDLLMYSPQERIRDLPCFYDNDQSHYTEQFLDLHNDYYEKLRQEVEEMKPILNMVKEFEFLLVEKLQLEESCRDSSRLLQRNSFRILKEEERTRTRLTKLIPKTIEDLKVSLQEFEDTHNKPLLIDGKIYYDTLLQIEEELNTKPSTKRKQQQQRSLSLNNQSAPLSTHRRQKSAPSPLFVESKTLSRRASTIHDETPVRRGLPTLNTHSSLRLNKATITALDDRPRPVKPLTPTSQILSPLYPSSTDRKRTLSPSRAVVSKISDEPPSKKLPILRSPIRSIGIPLLQPQLNRSNILPTLKYSNGVRYARSKLLKSPILLSSSDIDDIDDELTNKENTIY